MKIQLSKDFSISAIDYAIQGNAILGIKEAGKTYTATKIAEGLLDAGIPFIAFDPIGVWKNLRIGANGHAGYPVVVAAGMEGDLPLTPESVEGIVRAAMQENVALVLDLYTVMNKTYWRKIVETAVLTLLMENKDYGVRHIFIEEAAEFVPQKLGRSQFDVYSAIESLARMGGNVSLGYTLINQRAEDVNKSVLEIVERMILHRQSGKNSLLGIESWLKVTRIAPEKIEEIMTALPEMPSGECYVCAKLEHEPTRITVAPKVTIHPNRRDPKTTFKAGLALDVSNFVTKLKANLDKNAKDAAHQTPIKEKARAKVKISPPSPMVDTVKQGVTIDEMEAKEKEISSLKSEIATLRTRGANMEKVIKGMREKFLPDYQLMQALFSAIETVTAETQSALDVSKFEHWKGKLQAGEWKIVELLIARGKLNKKQLIVLTSYSRETIRIYVNKLKSVGLVKEDEEANLTLMEV